MESRDFYRQVIVELQSAKIPFQIGGALALRHYFGLERDTKDLDVFLRPRDVQPAMEAVKKAGFRAAIKDPVWLAKVFPPVADTAFVDLIFNCGAGIAPIDELWFEHGVRGRALGIPVEFCPPEETIHSKAFIMTRDRYDGGDICHLILTLGDKMDWQRLLWRFGDHWQVLLSHLILFDFIYPDHRAKVPRWVMHELLDKQTEDLKHERSRSPRLLCRGTLFSRTDYCVDIEKGYTDVRPDLEQDKEEPSHQRDRQAS